MLLVCCHCKSPILGTFWRCFFDMMFHIEALYLCTPCKNMVVRLREETEARIKQLKDLKENTERKE